MLTKLGEVDTTYSDERWQEFVQTLTIYPDGHLNFLVKSGDEIEVAP